MVTRDISLSREMSHFLLNVWILKDHPKLDSAKRTHFAHPTIDALIINETLYMDPAVGLYRTKLTEALLDKNQILHVLRQKGILKNLPICNHKYGTIVNGAIEDTANFLLQLITQNQSLESYNYFHLLECNNEN